MPSLQMVAEQIDQEYERERYHRELIAAWLGPKMRYLIQHDRHGEVESCYAATLKEAHVAASTGRRKCACGLVHGYQIVDLETGEQVA